MESWWNHPLPRRLLTISLAVFLVLLAAAFNDRLQEFSSRNEEYNNTVGSATAAMWTQEALSTEQAYARSDQAAIDWARREGRYIKEGDHPIVPLADAGDPSLAATPAAPPPTPMPNWMLWLRVFIGP